MRIRHEDVIWVVTSDLIKAINYKMKYSLFTIYDMFGDYSTGSGILVGASFDPTEEEMFKLAQEVSKVFFYLSSVRNNFNNLSSDVLLKPDAALVTKYMERYKRYVMKTFRGEQLKRFRQNSLNMCNFYMTVFEEENKYYHKLPIEIHPK